MQAARFDGASNSPRLERRGRGAYLPDRLSAHGRASAKIGLPAEPSPSSEGFLTQRNQDTSAEFCAERNTLRPFSPPSWTPPSRLQPSISVLLNVQLFTSCKAAELQNNSALPAERPDPSGRHPPSSLIRIAYIAKGATYAPPTWNLEKSAASRRAPRAAAAASVCQAHPCSDALQLQEVGPSGGWRRFALCRVCVPAKRDVSVYTHGSRPIVVIQEDHYSSLITTLLILHNSKFIIAFLRHFKSVQLR
jgi:hypothetical protein